MANIFRPQNNTFLFIIIIIINNNRVIIMDKFAEDLYSIYELINKNKDTKSIINTSLLSKQYLGYYLYRIFTKFIHLFENVASISEIKQIFKYLRIPLEHNRDKPYPLAGKMTNDEQLLDLIILSFLDIFGKSDKYIKSLPSDVGYKELNEFISIKNLEAILQDLVDLQKLLPGLSVSALRPNYLDDSEL